MRFEVGVARSESRKQSPRTAPNKWAKNRGAVRGPRGEIFIEHRGIEPGAHSPNVSEDDPSPEARAALKDYLRVSREIDALMRRTPQVRAQNREYFLFRGPLHHADAFPPIEGPWFQSPNIWWPDDRAWCVVTEVDGYSSYLGGTRECVASVLAADDLEAISVSSENRID